MLGLGCAVVVSRGSALKGAFALLLGLLFSTVGLSAVHTEARFTFGRPELYQGINFIPALVGLFGLSEVLRNVRTLGAAEPIPVVEPTAAKRRGLGDSIRAVFGGTFDLFLRRPWQTLQASAIGTLIGILPGAGADIAAWVSYGVSKRTSKNPDEYGRGSIEGVADSGAANNSALAGAWVPALTLGIPGDSITAIVLGIMMMKNLQPGPQIFEKQAVLVHSLFLVFVLANLALLPAGYLAIRASGSLMRVPRHTLLPIIVLFCVLGSYSIGGSYFDVGLMLAMGLLGFVLERWQVPVGPVVLGIILGGPLEERFIQAMTASRRIAVRLLRPAVRGRPRPRRHRHLAAARRRQLARAESRRSVSILGQHRLIQPYVYGIIVCMKKTLHIDEDLLRDARSACGAKTDTDTVRLGLEALVRHGAYERLRALRGIRAERTEIRRRRERASIGQALGRMIVLVDTSVWIRFLSNRAPYAAGLDGLLSRDEVSGHDFVYGELLIGDKGGRKRLLAELRADAPGARRAARGCRRVRARTAAARARCRLDRCPPAGVARSWGA